jgi:hypothetical protein
MSFQLIIPQSDEATRKVMIKALQAAGGTASL